MYPLYQNQKPYFWENEDGKRLLVWSGDRFLHIPPCLRSGWSAASPAALQHLPVLCRSNSLINPAIADTVALFNEKYGEEVTMRMVTLQELYDLIRDKVADAPVYRGAINE